MCPSTVVDALEGVATTIPVSEFPVCQQMDLRNGRGRGRPSLGKPRRTLLMQVQSRGQEPFFLQVPRHPHQLSRYREAEPRRLGESDTFSDLLEFSQGGRQMRRPVTELRDDVPHESQEARRS